MQLPKVHNENAFRSLSTTWTVKIVKQFENINSNFDHLKVEYLTNKWYVVTASLNLKSVDFAWNTTCYVQYLWDFHTDFNCNAILEMIPWLQLGGRQS